MSSFSYFCYLGSTLVEFLVFFGPVTWSLFLVLAGVAIVTFHRERIPCLPVVVGTLLPAIVPILILLVGVAFVRSESTSWADGVGPPVPWFRHFPPPHPDRLICALAGSQILLSGVLIWWSKRGWPLVLTASVCWGWCTVVASWVATMSVTGMWL